MIPWKQRSVEQANLLNPAFLSLLILDCFQGNPNRTTSYVTPFLVIPLALHGQTRQLLPKMTSKSFSNWITDPNNITAKAGFAQRAHGLAPFIRESLEFAASHQLILFEDKGCLAIGDMKLPKTIKATTSEVIEIRKATRFISKWFVKSGSIETTMILLGVKP